MTKSALAVNGDNYKAEVLDSNLPVVADFWAEWCMPCKMIAPTVDQLSAEYKDRVKFVKINVDDNARLATDLQILSIPVLIVFKNGKEMTRIVGANPKEFIKREIETALNT